MLNLDDGCMAIHCTIFKYFHLLCLFSYCTVEKEKGQILSISTQGIYNTYALQRLPAETPCQGTASVEPWKGGLRSGKLAFV